jgi:hypothetical protein
LEPAHLGRGRQLQRLFQHVKTLLAAGEIGSNAEKVGDRPDYAHRPLTGGAFPDERYAVAHVAGPH